MVNKNKIILIYLCLLVICIFSRKMGSIKILIECLGERLELREMMQQSHNNLSFNVCILGEFLQHCQTYVPKYRYER